MIINIYLDLLLYQKEVCGGRGNNSEVKQTYEL